MKTFERYFSHFPAFVDRALSWNPDFIVPAGKKGCKLLKSYEAIQGINSELLRYKVFFELSNQSVRSKKIAIIDDATQYTSTLQEYRSYFENLGAIVRTFSYVGHERLFEGKRWQYDEEAEVGVFLADPLYQEYILQQSYYLLSSGNHFDLDHLIFEARLPESQRDEFLEYLRSRGRLTKPEGYFLNNSVERFSLNNVEFFQSPPFLDDPSINIGPIRRMKFNYDPTSGTLLFSPLVFPTWKFSRGDFGNKLFRKVPFDLPFEVPRLIDTKNRGSVLRAYYNIYFVHAAALVKAFLQDIPSEIQFCSELRIRTNDLYAILGQKKAAEFMGEVVRYVCTTGDENFRLPRKSSTRRPRHRYTKFSEVIDDLKRSYLQKVKRKKTRVGVHHYLSYESLFAAYKDKNALVENLEYYRDLGVIVPETIVSNGRVERVIRTGEPDPDYNWKRTQVLIPLAIEQHRVELGSSKSSIDAMVLNKILSNFVYDYPSERYHDLHCLVGVPYTFGTLVHAYHHHRAPNRPSIYHWDKISPYYRWNERQKKFVLTDRRGMIDRIRTVFDDRQEVPYSEIVSYFRFCSRLYKDFRNVDVLTMLSICREQNYYYSHILYNVRTWLENYGLYLYGQDAGRRRKALYTTGTDAHSAQEKIRLAKGIEAFIKNISQRYSRDVEYLKILERVEKNYIPFSTQFRETLAKLEELIRLEIILTNLSLVVETRKKSYERKLERLNFRDSLAAVGIALPDDIYSLNRNQDLYTTTVHTMYQRIRNGIDSLKAEEPLLATRLQNMARERAANIATAHVYKESLSQAAFLYIDFSGLRDIPEPKQDIIARYYSLVEKHASKRSGVRLYGGHDGDDAYTYLFTDAEPALQCASDIKTEFAENLFLHTNGWDVKFGLSFVTLPEQGKEQHVLRGWGTAKDCCEFKGDNYRNRGDLLISAETVAELGKMYESTLVARFEQIEGEVLKGKSSELYRFQEIIPF